MQVGDSVQRVSAPYGTFRGMCIGDVDVVVSIDEDGEHCKLEHFGCGHAVDSLEVCVGQYDVEVEV